MLIENMMYFALGLLLAGLIALVIMPAVWKRAVRLTTRRIEAATPITLAEFRADKDQLRAEFALTTRRLEMTVETLRKRLAEQLGDANQKRTDLGAIKAERDQHVAIVKELETREAELRARVQELEKDGTDLSQRLRMRERDLETRQQEIEELRDATREGLPVATLAAAINLSGDYEEDIDRLTSALAVERKRAAFLEDQAKSLLHELETSDRRGAEASAAIAQMRDALLAREAGRDIPAEDLVAAEARIASAETRVNALLAETGDDRASGDGPGQQLLADRFGMQDELDRVRAKVEAVEASILTDWSSDRRDDAVLRDKLGDIASSISRLVYAADKAKSEPPGEESLFDRVQRFADDGGGAETLPAPSPGRGGAVTDRLTAVREIQGR